MDNMSRTNKLLLIIATLLPFVLVPALMALVFASMIAFSMQPGNANAVPSPVFFIGFFGVEALAILWGIGLFVLYLVHLIKTERLPQDHKALWGVILFLGGVIAMAVYWFMYIWREPAPKAVRP